MLAIAIAAPKISFDTFAMISSPVLLTRRRLDYIAANSITLWYSAKPVVRVPHDTPMH